MGDDLAQSQHSNDIILAGKQAEWKAALALFPA